MAEALEIVAGIMLGLGAVGSIFWLTFRRPPSIDWNASDWLSSGGYVDQGDSGIGHGGHHGA